MGPFIGKQLIQHLVKSNPSPGYVARVAVGLRQQRSRRSRRHEGGDHGDPARRRSSRQRQPVAMTRAPTAHFAGARVISSRYHSRARRHGELPELLSRATWRTWARIFTIPPACSIITPRGYVVPDMPLTGGEFQIFTTFTSLYRANLISNVFNNYSGSVQTLRVPA